MKKILIMLLAVAMLMVPVSILASAAACECVDCENCILDGDDCYCTPAEDPPVDEPSEPTMTLCQMFINHIKEYFNFLIAPILDCLNNLFGGIVVEG